MGHYIADRRPIGPAPFRAASRHFMSLEVSFAVGLEVGLEVRLDVGLEVGLEVVFSVRCFV